MMKAVGKVKTLPFDHTEHSQLPDIEWTKPEVYKLSQKNVMVKELVEEIPLQLQSLKMGSFHETIEVSVSS